MTTPDCPIRRRWIRNSALLLAGLVIGSIASELVARYSLPDFNGSGPPPIFRSSPLIPFTTRPLAEHLNIRHPGGDYVYSAHLDARGFRRNGPDRETDSLDGQGTLILGDSFAFGMGVDDDQTVAAELARSELKATCFEPVVNAGWTGGNNPATAAAWLAGQPGELRPRAVLDLVFPANDLEDIVPLELRRDNRGDLIQIIDEAAYVDESGHRRFSDGAGLRPVRDWLRNHVRLYYPIYERLAGTWPSVFGEQRIPRRDEKQARAVAVGAMQQASQWAARRAGSYTAVFVPSVEEVRAGRWRQGALELIDAAHLAGVNSVDLLSGLPRLTADNYYRTDAHWNPSGHAVVGRQLFSYLSGLADRACAGRSGG